MYKRQIEANVGFWFKQTGSYLLKEGKEFKGEFLKSEHYNALKKDTPDIYFTGNSISSTALAELVEICEGKDISINMISKAGTTTEDVYKRQMEAGSGTEISELRVDGGASRSLSLIHILREALCCAQRPGGHSPRI